MNEQELKGTLIENAGVVLKGYGRLKTKTKEMIDHLRPGERVDQTRELVVESPAISLAIAAGIGFIVGALLFGRRR